MIAEWKRVPRVQAGVRYGGSISGSFWGTMETTACQEAIACGRLSFADEDSVEAVWDRDHDEVVVTFQLPLVLPIRGSAL